jgi:hypothetical protein
VCVYTQVVSCQTVEWRTVLVHGEVSVPVELQGGENYSHPMGLINVDLQLVPLKKPADKSETPVYVEQNILTRQLEKEAALRTDIERRFQVRVCVYVCLSLCIGQNHVGYSEPVGVSVTANHIRVCVCVRVLGVRQGLVEGLPRHSPFA